MSRINMRQMKENQSGKILSVNVNGELGRRIRDMGLVPGTNIKIQGRAPLKDPVALRVMGFTLTLRNSEADYIDVDVDIEKKTGATIALAGNPNAGKTTLFNELTGSRQHVGNYPGVTVEKKEGFYNFNEHKLHIVDLPGTYSLTAYSVEEVVARDFLVDSKPAVVIDIVDASNLERNLYLTVQFLELGIPTCIALNMIDLAEHRGIKIDAAKLSSLFGVPVIPTIARTGMGKHDLVEAAVKLIGKKRESAALEISYGDDIDRTLGEIEEKIKEKDFLTDKYPARWIALKYLEHDDQIIAKG